MSDEAVATTQRRVCGRVGISAADRTRLTGGRPRPTTTTALPAGHVLELRYACMRIPATSGRVHHPWLPVYVPDIVDVDLDLDVDIPVPGPPGIGPPGIGRPGGPNIGRPGPAPDLAVAVGVAVGDARSQH